MEIREIDEDERQELHRCVLLGKQTLEAQIKSAEKANMPDGVVSGFRRLLRLYAPRVIEQQTVSGLESLFDDQVAMESEIDRKRAAAGEGRDSEGQADMFGGGLEIGGGIPAGQVQVGVRVFDEPATPDAATAQSIRDALAEIGELPAETMDMSPELVATWLPAGPYAVVELPVDEANGRPEATYGLTEAGERIADETPDAGEWATREVAERRAAWLNMQDRVDDLTAALHDAEHPVALVADDGTPGEDVVADYEIVDGDAPADTPADTPAAVHYESQDDDETAPVVADVSGVPTGETASVTMADDPWDAGPGAHRATAEDAAPILPL